MGVLTNDITRLRNEILALRSARQREIGDRRADVSQMLADFSKALSAVARRAKADRLGFISDLKRTVTDFLSEVRADLRGMRQAWLALGATSPRAVAEFASQPRLGAQASAEGRRSETGSKRPRVLAREEMPVRKERKR